MEKGFRGGSWSCTLACLVGRWSLVLKDGASLLVDGVVEWEREWEVRVSRAGASWVAVYCGSR